MGKQSTDYSEHYRKFYDAWQNSMTEAFELWTKNPIFTSKDSENDPTDFDPSSYYKKFYETWEKTTSEILEQWVNSPIFASNIGKTVEKSSEFKKFFDEIIERSLKNMHFPTKTDINNVLNSINNIEAKINDLTDMVDELRKTKVSPSKDTK